MKKLLLGALLASVPVAATAQAPANDADPALWVVKDDDTTVYLFGTFHMLDGKVQWFNDEVKTAFDSSDELVMEAIPPENPAEIQPLVFAYAIDPEGTKLDEILPPETQSKMAKAVADVGAPPGMLNNFEPWFAAITLPVLKFVSLGLKPEYGPETVLLAAARKDGMKIGELEGLEYQFSLFDRIPEVKQIAFLTESIDQISEIEELLPRMLGAWTSGEPAKMAQLTTAAENSNPELHALLFTRRNANWANWIDQRLDQPGTVFMAVGAGHLTGDDSVQNLLSKRGIASSRVQD